MHVVVNHDLIKRKKRLTQLTTFSGMAGLAVGFLLSWQMSDANKQTDWAMVTLSYAVLIASLVALSTGRRNLVRWLRRPRADEVLCEALPGLDPHDYLLSYLPTMPVEHMLISRRGVLVVVARQVAGEIRNRGAKWHRKLGLSHFFGGYAEGSLGNPGRDAEQGTEAVRSALSAAFGKDGETIPVRAVIVFTDGRAKVLVEEPAVPVVEPKDLRDFVHNLPGDGKLAAERVEQVARLFAPNQELYAKPPEEPKKKKQSVRLKRRALAKQSATDTSKMGRNRAERRMR